MKDGEKIKQKGKKQEREGERRQKKERKERGDEDIGHEQTRKDKMIREERKKEKIEGGGENESV